MHSYLRVTRHPELFVGMRRQLAVLTTLVAVGGAGCGSHSASPPAPQSMTETVTQFMAAVRAGDVARMSALWGTDRGPAAEWMKNDELKKRVTIIQRYL